MAWSAILSIKTQHARTHVQGIACRACFARVVFVESESTEGWCCPLIGPCSELDPEGEHDPHLDCPQQIDMLSDAVCCVANLVTSKSEYAMHAQELAEQLLQYISHSSGNQFPDKWLGEITEVARGSQDTHADLNLNREPKAAKSWEEVRWNLEINLHTTDFYVWHLGNSQNCLVDLCMSQCSANGVCMIHTMVDA